jgi:hypothetical protein
MAKKETLEIYFRVEADIYDWLVSCASTTGTSIGHIAGEKIAAALDASVPVPRTIKSRPVRAVVPKEIGDKLLVLLEDTPKEARRPLLARYCRALLAREHHNRRSD